MYQARVAYQQLRSHQAHAVAQAKALHKAPVVPPSSGSPVDQAAAAVDHAAIGAAAAALGVPQLAPVANAVASALEKGGVAGQILLDPLTAQAKLAAGAVTAVANALADAGFGKSTPTYSATGAPSPVNQVSRRLN